MQPSNSRRWITGWLAAWQLLASIVAVVPIPVWAQSIDAEPPLVDFQPVGEGVRGDSQVFTATVSDNKGVVSVVLHFRFDSDSLYQTREMQALGSTDIYTTTLESNDADEAVNSIQYYIEAADAAGNRTLEGFAFDPIERLLVDRPLAINEQNSATAADSKSIPAVGMSTGRKVLYGLLGVIVVGALASSSSGGGASSQPGVDVTVVVDPLP